MILALAPMPSEARSERRARPRPFNGPVLQVNRLGRQNLGGKEESANYLPLHKRLSVAAEKFFMAGAQSV